MNETEELIDQLLIDMIASGALQAGTIDICSKCDTLEIVFGLNDPSNKKSCKACIVAETTAFTEGLEAWEAITPDQF